MRYAASHLLLDYRSSKFIEFFHKNLVITYLRRCEFACTNLRKSWVFIEIERNKRILGLWHVLSNFTSRYIGLCPGVMVTALLVFIHSRQCSLVWGRLLINLQSWFNRQGCRGDRISMPIPIPHPQKKILWVSPQDPIPTEPRNPTYTYPNPVFSLQETCFNLLFVTLTVEYCMMYILRESVCDWYWE